MKPSSLFACAALFAQAAMADLDLRLITFNIRYAASSLMTNEKPWSTRRPLLKNQLAGSITGAASGALTVIGMQEVLHQQLLDIKSDLGSRWAHIGVARDDGKQSGEYCPILYDNTAVKLIYSETKWLSPTPDTPSFGWNGGSRRVITIGVFESIASGERFIAANTHLDNASSQARSEGIKVALSVIKRIQGTYGPLGVSLTGDFNSAPGGDAYTVVQNDGYLRELYALADASKRFGPVHTYTTFTSTTGSRIDFIWVGPAADNRWDVQRYEVLDNVKDGVYISDHRAVVGDLKLRT
ncbi:unnamed protein product [Parascedosporium putredinis]|uniref:Endonuclease/exonuclease/phosphatase domain-containing protein n=1 Tax=Parascedosporium putredinis TaxID=1442378 RepID=A0A9P1GXY0_9PEZI|nr:unnamed protein product [Parascedosporium putredinis]CAI7990154.1 unnamed protein product [Parascedosporium putredinis]